MSVLNQPKQLADVLLYEEPTAQYSRDAITIASGSGVVVVGTVIGTVTASGKYAPLAPAATDGSQTAIGIVGETVDATSADVDTFAIVRNAALKSSGLVWPTITAPQKAAAIALLTAAGLPVRTAV